jgi:SRSO17 transposase
MTETELRRLSPALAKYLDEYLFCCQYTQTFAHLGTYVRGLLSDLKRKTCEPIALKAGMPVRTLQEFLRDHLWSFEQVRDHFQGHVASLLPRLPKDDLGHVGLIDETSAAKTGNKTPGVARQYLGCLGKVDHGIVTVHLGVCKGTFKTLLDADLYLPKEWKKDRKRCRAAGIPDTVVHRPKWQVALEQLDRAKTSGIALDWLTFDKGYGCCPGFVFELDDREQLFVGEVPRSFSCLALNKRGQRPADAVKGRKAEDVVRRCVAFRSQEWCVLRLLRQSQMDQIWRVKAARVWLHSATGWSEDSYWLIWASNDETGEEKFFLSNAPADASVEVLVRVAFRRWNVEHCFRTVKGELGFTHFEGQRYVALMRHMTLCLITLGFVAENTQRLLEKKSGGDDGAGVPSDGAGVPQLAKASARHERSNVRTGCHRSPPGPERCRADLQEAKGACHKRSQKASPQTQKTEKAISYWPQVALPC